MASRHRSPEKPRHLLLLPYPPRPATFAAVKASYHPPLRLSLRDCANANAGTGSILEIALPCVPPGKERAKASSRSSLYQTVQSAVANVYKLVCIIAAQERINVEDLSGVDVRILLWDASLEQMSGPSELSSQEGPMTSLSTLSRCYRRWTAVFSVESEEGERILNGFLRNGPPRNSIVKLRGGIVAIDQAKISSTIAGAEQTHHFHSCVGGTFDHLHIGHKLLLTMTVLMVDRAPPAQSRTITVGITAEDLLKNKKYAEFLEDWHERYQAVHDFIHALVSFDPDRDHPETSTEINNPGPNGHAIHVQYPSGLLIKYVEIWDPFGPTITDPDIDALIISAETRSGGVAVNEKRKEKGWKVLDVFEVDVLDAEEAEDGFSSPRAKEQDVQQAFQNKLSSTEIRKRRADVSSRRSRV